MVLYSNIHANGFEDCHVTSFLAMTCGYRKSPTKLPGFVYDDVSD